MLQKELMKKIEHYLKVHKKRRRSYLILTALSAVMALSVYGALCLPAVSMTKDEPRLTAEAFRAVYGEGLSLRVKAEAPAGNKASVFALHTESNGAGLADSYEFEPADEDDEVCLIEAEDGSSLELHREFKGEGIVNYWFSLEPEETVTFTLDCNSDMYTLLEAEKEAEKNGEIVRGPAQETTEAETETSGEITGETAEETSEELTGQPEQGTEESLDENTEGSLEESREDGLPEESSQAETSQAGETIDGEKDETEENGKETEDSLKESGHSQGEDEKETESSKKEETVKETESSKKEETVKETESSKKEETVKETESSKKEETVKETESSRKEETVKEAEDSEKEEAVKEAKNSGKKTSAEKEVSRRVAAAERTWMERLSSRLTSAWIQKGYALDEETAEALTGRELGAGIATPSQLGDLEVASPSEVQDSKQYFRIFGGCGRKYSAALRASRSKNNFVELIWSEAFEERTFTATTESGITVVLTGPEDSFPEGDLYLEATEVVDESRVAKIPFATPSEFVVEESLADGEILDEEILDEDEILAREELDEDVQVELVSQRTFDIRLMDGGNEVQPIGPVTVTFEGITEEGEPVKAAVYHLDEEEKEARDMDAWTDDSGNVLMNTTHFSIYRVLTVERVSGLTVEKLAEGLGMASQFGVFTNYLYANGSEIEGSIAAKQLELGTSGYQIGNTGNVGNTANSTNQEGIVIRVDKRIDGIPPEIGQVYQFQIYNAKTNEPMLEEPLEITGEGSIECPVVLSNGLYYVRELDENGNPMDQNGGDGTFQVSYEGLNLSGNLGYLNDGSYVEKFVNSGSLSLDAKNGTFAFYVGEENTVTENQSNMCTITTPEGNQIHLANCPAGVVHQPTNIDWEGEFQRLWDFSEELSNYTTTYNRLDTTSPGVKVLSVTIPAGTDTNGILNLVQKAAGITEGNGIQNGQLKLGADQYLILNLDFEEDLDTIYLPAIAPNGSSAGWNKDFGRFLWNITTNGNCYEGTVYPSSGQSAGTVFVPGGTVIQNGTHGGTFIADRVEAGGAEIHQISIRLKGYAQTTVTNTYPKGTDLVITKENLSGAKLWGAEFELWKADESWEPIGTEAVATETSGRNGKLTFKDLEEGNYLLYETIAPEGYVIPAIPWKLTVSAAGVTFQGNPGDVTVENTDLQGSCIITNEEKVHQVNVHVEKKWEVAEGETIPESITVWLLADGVRQQPSVTLNASNSWSYDWNGLPQDQDGVEIIYTVEEEPVPGYTGEITSESTMVDKSGWIKATQFTEGGTYLLVSGGQAISSEMADNHVTMKSVDLNATSQTGMEDLLWQASEPDENGGVTLRNGEDRLSQNTLWGSWPPTVQINTNAWSENRFYYSHDTGKDTGKLYTIGNGYSYVFTTDFSAALSGVATGTELESGSDYTLYTWTDQKDIQINLTLTNKKQITIPVVVDHKKTIDALRDDQNNPDTTLDDNGDLDKTDLYRLYLDFTVKKDPAAGDMTGATEPYITHVTITDKISQYVQWYGTQPDVLVTKKSGDGTVTELWKGSGTEESGNIGTACEGNTTTQDGKPISIIQSVAYTPVPDNDQTTGTVVVTFHPEYQVTKDDTYTLSFNVKTTQTAYEEYAANRNQGEDGYGSVQGDPDTDFSTETWINGTSSEKPGFHSNHAAYVNYRVNESSKEEPYDHPVIQVAACELQIKKMDVANFDKFLEGAEFDLYREAKEGETGAVGIPYTGVGAEAKKGIKINVEPLRTNTLGIISVTNLTPGNYYLVETKAPVGYQLLTTAVSFQLRQDGVDVTGAGADTTMFTGLLEGTTPTLIVRNTSGFEMPETGGRGRGIYTLIGWLMMSGTALYFIKKQHSKFSKVKERN